MSRVTVLPIGANNLQNSMHSLVYNSLYLHIISRVFFSTLFQQAHEGLLFVYCAKTRVGVLMSQGNQLALNR